MSQSSAVCLCMQKSRCLYIVCRSACACLSDAAAAIHMWSPISARMHVIPVTWQADACATPADQQCDTTVVLLQVVGSPIGAYLLLHLDSAHLQLSIAGVLTLVFLSMVVTPAQFKQSWKSLKDKLASHKKAQHAQHEGYSTLPPTPTFGAMHYTDTPKSNTTELSQAKPLDPPQKGGNIPQDSQILKPSALPVPVVSTSSGSGSGNSSSSLGNLAPQAPPPINIHPPSSAPPASAEFPLNSAHSNWSLQNSTCGGSRRGSMTAASFNPESLQSRLDSESGVSILARHNARQAPPVVRVSQASLDLVKQDVQSYHSSSPAMSWMRRLQPDPSTVVINYPVEYSWEDMESGQSPLPSPVPTPVPTRPPSPSPHADTNSGETSSSWPMLCTGGHAALQATRTQRQYSSTNQVSVNSVSVVTFRVQCCGYALPSGG